MTPMTSVTRCRCGHDGASPSVRPVKRYGWLGVMALLMGYTSRPVRIDWVCTTCETVIESITDPAVLERCRYDEPRRAGTSRPAPALQPPSTETDHEPLK